ncbi:glycosyltransferase [Microbacterium sp. NPDC076911]|uniref:glycosyltransferase n=1 Tax=Microbacterium sp. NPDC076911 TaxID=3154958 RepID=UPI003422D73D
MLPGNLDDERLPLYLRAETGAVNRLSARSFTVEAHSRVSFGTYFNAFPAAYWVHSTGVRELILRIEFEGKATVRVHRSDSDGHASLVATEVLTTGLSDVPISLRDDDDQGSWLWFDIATGDVPFVVMGASWRTVREPVRAPMASIGITTFNKPDYCVEILDALRCAPELHRYLARVRIVDQGERRVVEHPNYVRAVEGLDELIAVLPQDNLGGSGGYARVMAESLQDRSTCVLLLDDDVKIEPEAIRRAIMFSAHCRVPTIVGGHMFDLLDPLKLYAWAEVVDEEPFMWRTLHAEQMPIDFAESDLRDVALLHQRMDVDYNGWWMSLIPREALESVGLPMPAFIKWDDAEYSLRAAQQSIPTVTLPGVALWHVSWVGKDDLIDWQAYFHARNRIVAALLHSEAPRGGSLLRHSRRVDLKHFMSMQYYPVALRHHALRDVLSGPAHMHAGLRTALASARALELKFPETRAVDAGARRSTVSWSDDDRDAPRGWRLPIFLVRSLASQWLHRPRPASALTADVVVAAKSSRWWRLAQYDSALVTMAATGETRLFVRDRKRFRMLMLESLRLHRELRRRWRALSEEYRAADLSSLNAWTQTFDATHSSSSEDALG